MIAVTEWLARLHGLSYVLLNKHPGGPQAWLDKNRWIRDLELDDKDAKKDKKGIQHAFLGKTTINIIFAFRRI